MKPRSILSSLQLCLLCALVLLASSCVYSRLDGSTLPSRAFEDLDATSSGIELQELCKDHPGDSALYVLNKGLDAFAARVAVIDGAERAVDAQYYIYRDDITSKYLMYRMLAAADRGVRVRLLLDDLGTTGIDDMLAAANVHPNMEVRLFNPRARGPWTWFAKTTDMIWRPLRINRRMHNKMLTGDGVAAIIGGRNIADEYFDASEGVNFGDLDLLALGPVVQEAGRSFDLYWNSSLVKRLDGWSSFKRKQEDLDKLQCSLEEDAEAASETKYSQRVDSSDFVHQAMRENLPLLWAPARALSDLPWKIYAKGDEIEETLLITMLGDAMPDSANELLIVSPYFVPKPRGVEYLCGLVEKGVHVRILTNAFAATDVPMVHAGYMKYRKKLLEGGVELYEIRPSGTVVEKSHRRGLLGSSRVSLHAKTFIADRKHVFVGSLNLDPRSVDLNTEVGLVIDSEELAEGMLAGLDRALDPEICWQLTLEDKKIVWNGTHDGETLRYTEEPGVSTWNDFSLWFLRLIPIEGQL